MESRSHPCARSLKLVSTKSQRARGVRASSLPLRDALRD
jgi:hypothetical protein